jgi:CDP-6-deoxy-D-xylo-4-hexulose-3-dehydrase
MKKVWYAPNKFESYGREEIDAVTKCLEDGWLAGFGPKTIEFEQKVSEIFGKKYGLFVNSGSSACLLALASLNLPKGSEIITPACTFSTTVAPIIQLGLVPVFCDVQLDAYVPSVKQVLEKITDKTAAIMIPNLIGNKPDWEGLRTSTNLVLIEDSADTITCTPWTDISTTSFYASHIITAGGSGGMVMFNDVGHLKRATMFRDWGRIGDNSEDMNDRFAHSVDGIPYDYKFLYGCLGYNFKSSEMNAAFGLVQLQKFQKFKETRRRLMKMYIQNLKDVPGLVLPDDCREPNWLAIPLQHPDRLNLLTHLENMGIQTRVTFSGNVTRHPVYREYYEKFTNSDTIMRNGFLLGCHHGMTDEDVDYVCDAIKTFVSSGTE